MDKAKIILEELKEWVYNDENQAGAKLQIIDADDIFSITETTHICRKCDKEMN